MAVLNQQLAKSEFQHTLRPLKSHIPYSGKLLREKTFMNWWKIRYSRRKLSWIARLCHSKERHIPNFVEKTFTNGHKTRKFVKVFSLESFPLYGIVRDTRSLTASSNTRYIYRPLKSHDDTHGHAHLMQLW